MFLVHAVREHSQMGFIQKHSLSSFVVLAFKCLIYYGEFCKKRLWQGMYTIAHVFSCFTLHTKVLKLTFQIILLFLTRDYADGDEVEKFTDSQFLVFVNRILAFAFSGVYLLIVQQNVHRTPLYKYSYCSVSNTLSSWCQYEALKFVSFPTQVKTLPLFD